MITRGIVRAQKKDAFSEEINVVERVVLKVPFLPQQLPVPKKVILTVTKPEPFLFKDTHAVPWNYESNVEVRIPGEVSKPSEIPSSLLTKESPAEVARVGGFTRSGRCYGPTEVEPTKGSREEKEEKLPKDKEEEKAEEEFLSIVKQSDFDVVQQLNKTPARISFLSLILSSESHRRALLKVLNKAFIEPTVTADRFVGMIDPTSSSKVISFSKEEINPNKQEIPQALHITVKCKGYRIGKVLIDGGSALNVLPKSTLLAIPMTEEDLKPRDMVVRAFDGNRTKIMGEVVLPLVIGPTCFHVLFQVMEIDAAYTMLLGRPWIHQAGAVPSTLHQRVKFLGSEGLIVVKGEDEIMLSKPVSMPYMETTRMEDLNEVRNFEVIDSVIDKGKAPMQSVNSIAERIMANYGYQKGKGLGSSLQGIAEPIEVRENIGKGGLGYQDTLEGTMRNMMLEKKEGQRKLKHIPHISETFPAPAAMIMPQAELGIPYKLIIGAIEEDSCQSSLIQLVNEEDMLGNWHIEPVFNVVFEK